MILMCDAYHLHTQELSLTPSRLVGRCRFESPRGKSPAFDDERNTAVGFYLLFHLVRGQLDRKRVSGLYQRCKCDHHVQHERYGPATFDVSLFLINLFRFLHLGHWSDIQGGVVIGDKDCRCCDKVRGPEYVLVVWPLDLTISRLQFLRCHSRFAFGFVTNCNP